MIIYSVVCLLCIVLFVLAVCLSLVSVLIYQVFSSFMCRQGGGCYD